MSFSTQIDENLTSDFSSVHKCVAEHNNKAAIMKEKIAKINAKILKMNNDLSASKQIYQKKIREKAELGVKLECGQRSVRSLQAELEGLTADSDSSAERLYRLRADAVQLSFHLNQKIHEFAKRVQILDEENSEHNLQLRHMREIQALERLREREDDLRKSVVALSRQLLEPTPRTEIAHLFTPTQLCSILGASAMDAEIGRTEAEVARMRRATGSGSGRGATAYCSTKE